MATTCLPLSCPGPIDRRTWLKIGGLSLGALVSGVEPNLARLFAAEEAAAPRRPPQTDFSVILFWANGGPSHLDTFDLKPDAPAEIRGPFRPIRTNVPGMDITEQLPTLAKMANRFALVRSLHHNRAEHSGGTHRFLTGYSSVAANLKNSEFPDIGSIVAKRLESPTRDVPLYVGNTKFYGGGPAYLGPAYAPFMPSPNPLSSTGNNTYDPVPLYIPEVKQSNLVLSPDGALRCAADTVCSRRSTRCRRCVTGPKNSVPSTICRSARSTCWSAVAPGMRSTCRGRLDGRAPVTATPTGARAC